MITTHSLPTQQPQGYPTSQGYPPSEGFPPSEGYPPSQQVPDVKGGFTRRCGKRDPVDKSPCMFEYGHAGRHGWEPVYF
jgi:hypothetical protein